MKRLSALLVLLMLVVSFAQAQSRQVTGTVTGSDDGKPLPGVSIQVKGTSTGGTTDIDGKYSINVPADANTLVFSFVGFKPQEVTIGDRSIIDVILESESQKMEEVVVTALGITREKKALGYSVQDVKGDELTQSRQSNVLNSLSGRVAGVQVTTSSGNLGGSSRILVRGVKSVSANNQPLFVVDGIPIDNSDFNSTDAARGAGGIDYGNMAQDINPDDIANVSILKGASATALYGSRAANGVILITTKSGKASKGKSIGVSVNTGVSWEQVSLLPKYQNEYGGGGLSDFEEINVGGVNYKIADYATDESWGPKYDPNLNVVQWFNLYDWEANNKVGPIPTSPWVKSAHDVKSFFKTGVTLSNNVSFSGGDDKTQYRLSYTNVNTDGYMPNSTLRRNTVNFNGSTRLGEKLRAFSVLTYVKNEAQGRPVTGYDDNNIMQKFNQWGQRQLDMDRLKNYKQADGTQRTWNRRAWDDPRPNYSDNPYWTRYENAQKDVRDRFYGNVGLSYSILPYLDFQFKVNMDTYLFRQEEKIAKGSQALSSYSEGLRNNTELNTEFLLTFDKALSETFHLNASFGGNQMTRKYWYNYNGTTGGLVLPHFYNVNNSVSAELTVTDFNSWKRINSLYGSASLGWKRMLFLDLTVRNDWSSTLPSNENSYLYPSVTSSFVFTELPVFKSLPWFTFGKVRLGWAQVGNDTDPYRLTVDYTNLGNFGSDIVYSMPGTLNSSKLKPETNTSYEIGTELRFFMNRLGIDFTYYSMSSTNQILPVTISGASGFLTQVINAGEITNKGVELELTGTPVQTKGFSWDIVVNFAKNKNKVVKLADGVDNYQLANGPFSVSVNAFKGQSYGTILGTDFVYAPDGQKVIGDNGRYLKTTDVVPLGNYLPNWNAGITNVFSYKGFQLSCLIDIQNGGQLFSTTNMWGHYSGILKETAENGIRENGLVLKGVVNVGTAANPVYVENTRRISAERWAADFYSGPAKQNIFNTDYIKLREVAFSYTIPSKYTGPVQNVKISIFGRNLAMWNTDNQHIDPESSTSAGNIQGIEGAQLPSLRTFGFNLSCNF